MSIDIASKQKNLALKAKERPNERIGSLYSIIDKEWIEQALWNVLQNTGAKTEGIDGKVKGIYYDSANRKPTSEGKELVDEICKN